MKRILINGHYVLPLVMMIKKNLVGSKTSKFCSLYITSREDNIPSSVGRFEVTARSVTSPIRSPLETPNIQQIF